ncbi:MAG TPA: LOG family protein [Candidatus Binatia bacterium]|nr:LOG family protein [Candidatus Binatia bacterium]
MTKTSVAVFGSSKAPRDSPHHRLARELGAALARRGAVVRCGGYGGVMEAVTEGARSAGGKVVGCTLAWYQETRVPSSELSEVVEASDLYERIRNLLAGTRAAVVLPGGVGTMNELFWVWTLLTHDRDEDPDALVLVGEGWDELLDLLDRKFEFGPDLRGLLRVARDAEEAAAIAWGA